MKHSTSLFSTANHHTMEGFYNIFGKSFCKHPTMLVTMVPAMEKPQQFSLLDGNYHSDIRFPVIFRHWAYNRKRAFLFGTWGWPVLIAADFKAKLEKHGITGWKTFPARLLDKKGEEIPGYEGFSITGRCGPRDRSKAIRIEKKSRSGMTIYYDKGVFLDLDTWDGSDIFIERHYWSARISPKAAKVFKTQDALELTSLLEVEIATNDYWFYYKKQALPSQRPGNPVLAANNSTCRD